MKAMWRVSVWTLCMCTMWLVGISKTFAQKNGQLWPDVDGKHINAHGGNIIKYGDTYYWYGENRPDRGFTTEVGVEVYSSTDLRSWKDEGVALAVSETPGSDIERGCIMERPKVLHNPRTNKFVMLFHLELKGKGYAAARVAFAESDTPTGPFRFIRSTRVNAGIWPFDFSDEQIAAAKATDANAWKDWWTPEWRKETAKGMYLWRDMEGGQMSRDMTVFIDDDGKAYHITSSQENLTLLVSELTDDYLDFTGKYNTIAPGGQNEAPTIVKRDGKYWLICSGCTGWDPNEARMFVADNIWGPWTQLPSPFTGEDATVHTGREDAVRTFPANKTFGAQGTYILDLGDRQLFMADIWNPRHLSRSMHIWLPIEYAADGTPVIRWTENPLGDEVQQSSADAHLLFQGVSISGNIDEFTENMKPRYKLRKKVGGEHYFIYEGSVFGYNTYLQASFSRKSRTVYKVLVTPKAINQQAWVDSLTTLYGEPLDTERGLMWQRPEGVILFYAPEGYDCALFFLDHKGNEIYLKEK